MTDVAASDFRHSRRYVRLDTILRLRWLAVLGQLAAIFIVVQGLEFDLPVIPCVVIVGLSGLLTLAFDAMKDTIEGIDAAGLRGQVKIMIGGSPVDEQVCTYSGADGWGRDAAAALQMAADWTGGAA